MSLLSFPNPVDEVAARTVAAGVVGLSVGYLLTGWFPILAVLAYGFVARVAAGPRFSPLGLIATRVVAPRLASRSRLVAGPPKRFAQGIGAVVSLSAVVAHLLGAGVPAQALVGALVVAAGLEAALGFCLGCTIFAGLMRTGLVPEEVCAECADITRRLEERSASAA